MGQSSQPVIDPLVGSTVGRYVIQAHVGEGGMGTVYRAEQTPLGRPVALKVIHRALVSDQKVVSRFLREAKIACQLTNPHTVTIFDFGNEDGVLYLAMELLQGESLHERLCRGPVEPVRAAEVAAQVGRSLTEAHQKGIIHRDLKPDNIFLSTADDGSLLVKVLDYGLARVMSSDDAPGGIQATLTQIGTIVGTPIYMSPEQARGRKLDARTDLYSMGVVLFEMLSGVAPFLDEDAVVVLGKHIRDPVPRIAETGARVAPPAPLQVLVDKLLEKEPSKRPPDAAWVYQELRTYLSQSAGRSARLPAMEEPSRPGFTGTAAPDAPPPRISPPDAASGVQARVDEAAPRDSKSDWAKTDTAGAERARRLGSPAPGPDELGSHPTIRMDSQADVLSEAPTTVPVRPKPAASISDMPTLAPPTRPPVRTTQPGQPERPSAPGVGAAPSLSSYPSGRPAPRRVPLMVFAIGVPVLAALVALVVTVFGRHDGTEITTATPVTTTATPSNPVRLPPLPAGENTPPPTPPNPRLPQHGASPAQPGATATQAEPDEPPAPRGMTPRDVAPGGWAGSYQTSRGAVELAERGALVTGRFGSGGRLQGRADGSVLRFTWLEGAESGNGVLRSFQGPGGRVVVRGSWGADDPDGVHAWIARDRPVGRGKIRPTKRPGDDGLVIGSDSIFGPGKRNNPR